MINGLVSGAVSGGWLPGLGAVGGVNASDLLGNAALLGEADPTKNPQPLSLYVFLFMTTALALLLLSMFTHMKRARRNLGQPDSQPKSAAAPPQSPSGGPREVG